MSAWRRAAARASRAVRPAALSQAPGPRMRAPSSVGSVAVPAGKTVSRWAESEEEGLVCVGAEADVGELGEGVAGVVEVEVGEAEGGEALEEPGGAGLLGEGGRGDGEHLELPAAELGLVQMQPVEGAVDGELGGEAGDAALGERGLVGGGRGGHSGVASGYSTETRKRPLGGGGGAGGGSGCGRRGCAGMAAGERRPAAASTKVPTRLRTMWWRKPEPVTR